MHKRLEADLMSLAHSILRMKNKEDVFALKEKSKEVYEKLSLLSFVEEYINTTPNSTDTKDVILDKVTQAIDLKESKEKVTTIIEDDVLIDENLPLQTDEAEEVEEVLIDEKQEVVQITSNHEEIIEQPFDELEQLMFASNEKEEELIVEDELKTEVTSFSDEESVLDFEPLLDTNLAEELVEEEVVIAEKIEEVKVIDKDDVIENITENKAEENKVEERKIVSLEEELQDTIPVDEIADLFSTPVPVSLNDRLASRIQIGLNDRIAFVKNLFEGSQEDFNRVVSQLNTYSSEKEAVKFINKMVKPDYDWTGKEDVEARFLEIVARKFA